MLETAKAYGFREDHIGCPCEGSPRVLKMEKGNTIYTLKVWVGRGMWRLTTKGYTIAQGNAENIKTKLNEYGLF